jgi:hypothetical protein
MRCVIVVPPPGLDTSRRRPLRLRGAAPISDDPLASLLAMRATELLRAVETGAVAPRWRTAGFGRAVDEIRAQLAPIEGREMLSASFGREAALRLAGRGATADPLDLAYAVRWLELDPARPRPIPAWAGWLPIEPG